MLYGNQVGKWKEEKKILLARVGDAMEEKKHHVAKGADWMWE